MKQVLKGSVSIISLCLMTDMAWGMHRGSDEDEGFKSRYSVGKDWDDSRSVASNSFSVRGYPATQKEELSYDEEDGWERGTARSDLDNREVRGQKLAEIKNLKKYLFKGNIEITPENHQVLLKHSIFYETAFKTYDKGVTIKGWNASLGFEDLTNLLHNFENLRTFKINIKWDKEGDISETITRAIQFYENLTELDISNCRLTDEAMVDIMESVADPKKLSLLNVTENKLSKDTLISLKKHFPNLASFKSDADLEAGTSTLSQKGNTSIISSLQTLSLQEKKEAIVIASPITQSQQIQSKGKEKDMVLPEEERLDIELLKKANAGDAASQYNLGEMYLHGRGVPKDEKEAVRWYRLAADQGRASAQCRLGVMYAGGHGVPKDEKEAVRWYRLAADQGRASAQCSLGVMYADGRGVPKDEKEAVRWYRLAADQGDALAQHGLGVMYADGCGVPKDEKEAVRWFRLAADQGRASAQCSLGVMYADGRGVPKDEKEAVRWCRLAADQGDALAQYGLGMMYAHGRGIPKDEKEGVRWYRLAADQGDALAQHGLGVMYADGRGVPKDEKEAVRWYRLAADQGRASAQCRLGVMYAGGHGVPKDEKEAVRWYRLAADQGRASAQCSLGVMYADGRGVPKDEKEAVRWYRLAADQGLASAQYGLGVMYAGGHGVPKDEKEAVRWFRLAADQGLAEAKNALGGGLLSKLKRW